jgi:glycosyltransferase involved in cell wall biosynthesis
LKNKLKIGFFLSIKPYAGGMFQYTQSILDALLSLNNQHFDIIIVYQDDRWREILAKRGVQVKKLSSLAFGLLISDALLFLRTPRSVAKKINVNMNPLVKDLMSYKCDAWIFSAQESLTYQVPFKTIAAIHDLMHRYEKSFPEASSLLRYPIRDFRFKNITQNSEIILVDSFLGRDQVIESYAIPKKKISVLPYVYPQYLKQPYDSGALNQHYKLPKKFIFYPAQFWPHKNHLNLIKALSIALEKCPEMYLVLTGSKSRNYKNIISLIDKLNLKDRVRILGYVPDANMAFLYHHARAMIMPTFFGPTNIPPLEALSCGCPVLVSNVYAMPEQLGKAALYFDPTSPNSIADAIKKIWSNDRLHKTYKVRAIQYTKKNDQSRFNQIFKNILTKLM